MATSGTYNFLSPKSVELITDAYERVMTIPDPMPAQLIQTAQRSINLMFSSWYNRGWNLWTTQRRVLGIYAGQNTYTLPIQVQDLLWAELRTSNRLLGGIAISSAGNAQNAFDNNPATFCDAGTNGFIGYNWQGAQYAIQMVGIQSQTTANYTLNFQYSFNGTAWTTVYSVPTQSYQAGILNWFVITSPTLGTYFRVIETNGADLNLQELYFNNALYDTRITPLSAVEYDNQPNKNSMGRPTSYYFNRLTTPTLTLWLTPSPQYNAVLYTTKDAIQDIGQLQNNAEIPARFLEPAVAGLAHRLAVKLRFKYNIPSDVIATLKAYADEEFDRAAKTDTENVPTRIYPDMVGGWFR